MKDIRWYKHPMLWTIVITMFMGACIGFYLRWYHPPEPWQPYETTINFTKSSVENNTWRDSLHVIQTDSKGNIIKEFILYYR